MAATKRGAAHWRQHSVRTLPTRRQRGGDGVERALGSGGASINAGALNRLGRRTLPATPACRPTNVRRPQTASLRHRQVNARRSPGDNGLHSLSLPPPVILDLPLVLESKLSRSFPLERETALVGSPDQNTRTAYTRRWSEQRQGARKWIAEGPRVREHPIDGTLPNTRNPAVEPAHGLAPHMLGKQLHPLVRSVQNRRIAPGQTPQILAIHAEIPGSLNDVAEMPAQSPRRLLVAQMRQRRRPLRKHRHQRSTRSGFDLGQGRFGGRKSDSLQGSTMVSVFRGRPR